MENSLHTILIVDDNPDILRLLYTYLHFAGFKVYAAESGASALEKAETIQPDVILLDVLMPNMDGFETCRRLAGSEKTKDIPVIFLTALSDTDSKIRGFKAGAVDYVTKPFQNEEVIARVTTHITLRKLQQRLELQNQKLQDENLKRRRVQEALLESRERYRLLADNATDIISRQTPEGIYRYVSPACRGVLGYEIEEMVGKRELDFVCPEDVPLVENALGKLKSGETKVTYTYRAIRKNGSLVWLETTNKVIRHPADSLPMENIAVSRNVPERKEAEQALQQSHDLLEIRVQERTAELIRLNVALRRFVPHEFLHFLGKESIVDVQLGDQVQRNMTILTADIRSFSTLSEKMSPQENFNFLNTYLSRVSPIIRQNDGFIDKYIGDAVMALFPDEAENALQSAIDIKQEVVRFNADMARLAGCPSSWVLASTPAV
jgi:PAS domain S-box-containing protein